MSLEQLTTVDAIRQCLEGTQNVAFSVKTTKQNRYRRVQKALVMAICTSRNSTLHSLPNSIANIFTDTLTSTAPVTFLPSSQTTKADNVNSIATKTG